MSRAPEELLALSEPDPEWTEFTKSTTIPKFPSILSEYRKLSQDIRPRMVAALGEPPRGITEHDHEVQVRDGSTIKIRSYTPNKAPEGRSPLIVMNHGGGFCVGGLDSEAASCRKFAAHLGAVALDVDYRLAPEFPFPVGVGDAWDALKWAAGNAGSLKANPGMGFIVAGVSSGGNFAAVLAHLARNEGLKPALTGQFLSIAPFLPENVVPQEYQSEYLSRGQNREAPIIPSAVVNMFDSHYKPDDTSPLYVPFNDPTGHSNLPPAYFQICGLDPLRDEGLLYERVLRQRHGVKTRVDLYPGFPHAFWLLMPRSSAGKNAAEDVVNGMKWLLEVGREEK